MALAQVPSEIVVDPRQYMFLLYGDAGVGKTTFASQIPGHYFAKTEDGTQGVSVFGDNIPTFDTFRGLLNELLMAKEAGWKDEQGNPMREVKLLVVDTYERLFDLAGKWVCEKERFLVEGKAVRYDRIEDVVWGRGYARVNELLIDMLVRFQLCGFGILLLSHTKERQVKWKGQMISMYGPDLSGSAVRAIVDACGAVARYMIDETVAKDANGNVVSVENCRTMFFESAFQYEAKHRLANFPASIKISRQNGWQDYLDAFQKAVLETKAEKENADEHSV